MEGITLPSEILKRYKEIKRTLSMRFNVQEKYVQYCLKELIDIAKINNNSLSAALLYKEFKDKPDLYFYKLIDWTRSEETVKDLISRVLSEVPFLIDELNTIYFVQKNERPDDPVVKEGEQL